MKIPTAVFCLLLAPLLSAQVPHLIHYQSRVAVGGVNFDGTGQFRFALVNPGGTITFWSNDGSSSAGSLPTAAVTLAVSKGLYSVLLGDTSLANMAAISGAVWANADVRLRVWFNDGANGLQLLAPDHRLAANGYLPDGAVTPAKIATGAVGSAQLAPGAAASISTSQPSSRGITKAEENFKLRAAAPTAASPPGSALRLPSGQ